MLRKISQQCILMLLILSLLCSSFVYATTGTLKSNTGARDTVCTALSTQAKAYYTGSYTYAKLSALDGVSAPKDSWATTQGNDLYDALQKLMSSTHESYPQYSGYYSDSLATYWAKTDAEAGSSSYLYFYTDVLSTSISATMNREHVWPKANASYSQKNGGADLHHLRPSIESVNQDKSNYTFADVVGELSSYSTSYISGEPVIWYHSSGKVLEVRDNVKGDVARILLYVYCRWGQPNLYTDVASSKLPALDSDDTTNNGVRAIDDLDTLLRWCELDPVDTWEMSRNDQTENVQGNRNVFIDYPEFAWLIFNQTPPSDMPTPSGQAEGSASYTITASTNNSSYGTVSLSGNVITAKPATGYQVSGYTILSGQATVVQDGNTFTVTPQSNCSIRINFTKKSTITVSFSAADSMTGYAGDSFTLPSATAPEGYTFIGWCTSTVADTTTLPTYYTAGKTYIVNSSIHLYALYSYSKETVNENADYVKLTSAPADWSGDYVIVYESAGYIFNGSLTSPNARNNYKAVSIQNQRITASSADAYRVTIAPCTGGYSIRTASNLYIGNTTTGSSLSTSSTTAYPHTLTMNSNGTVRIAAANGTYLRYYGSTQRRFLYSSSTSYYLYDICLYRKDSLQSTTFYTTEICLHKTTKDVITAATCETDGTLTVVCADCGKTMSTATLPATGHSYTGKVTTAATCTKAGVKTYTCSKCNDSYTEAIAATGHTVVTDKAVAATCTANGKTEGSHCSVCNTVIKAQTTISALGHDYRYTNNGSGSHTVSCTRCSSTFTETHKFEGDTCICGAELLTVDESIKIYHTLDLASDISITFAVQRTALSGYDTYYMEVVLPEYEGNELTNTSTIRIEPVENGNYYYFTLTGITAVRMGDLVDATLHMTKGTQEYISTTDSYSVATYAYAMLNSTKDSKILTLCADLLRYGAEAQSYKKYRTDSLVDAKMTATHRSYLSNTDALTFTATDSYLGDLDSPTITWVGKTLDLGSKVGLKFVFNTQNYSGNVENLSMKVSYAGSNGETKTLTLTGAEVYNASKSYYSFTFYDLLASELRTIVDVAIFNGNTQLSETLRYSAESYASKAATGDLAPLCKALFAYSDSAKAYFTK